MKKKSLLILLPAAMLLASCGENEGESVEPEEALDKVASMKAHVEDDSFELPTKLTVETTTSTTNEGETYDAGTYIAIDMDNYYIHCRVTATGENDADVYYYLDGDSYIVAVSDGTTKTYTSLPAATAQLQFETYITGTYDEASWKEIISDLYGSLDSACEELVSYAGSSLDLSELGLSYSIKSKGDGHLALTLSETYSDSSYGSGSASVSIEFADYLPSLVSITSTSVDSSYSLKESFKWGSCSLDKPDLSGYTIATASI